MNLWSSFIVELYFLSSVSSFKQTAMHLISPLFPLGVMEASLRCFWKSRQRIFVSIQLLVDRSWTLIMWRAGLALLFLLVGKHNLINELYLIFMLTHRGCTLSLVAEMIKNTYHKHQTTILSHKLLCMQQKFSLHSAQHMWASGGQSMSMIFLRDRANTGLCSWFCFDLLWFFQPSVPV